MAAMKQPERGGELSPLLNLAADRLASKPHRTIKRAQLSRANYWTGGAHMFSAILLRGSYPSGSVLLGLAMFGLA